MTNKGVLGIMGGSGFDKGLEGFEGEAVDIETGYTMTRTDRSVDHGIVRVMKGELNGVPVVFANRHQVLISRDDDGTSLGPAAKKFFKHGTDPANTNYRALVMAMKQAGVTDMISFSLVGSLSDEVQVGMFYIPTSIEDHTQGRDTSFYGVGAVVHRHYDPCHRLQGVFQGAAQVALGEDVLKVGTYYCIQGPEFRNDAAVETASRDPRYDVIGMTYYPEAKLAGELEMCWAGMVLVTDKNFDAVNDEIVGEAMKRSSQNVGIAQAVAQSDFYDESCACHRNLESALLPVVPELVQDKWLLDKVLRPKYEERFVE